MKSPTNFRLEENTLTLLTQLAHQHHTTRTAIVERAIREYAHQKQAKKNRLLALAGALDKENADTMLEDIQASRQNKDLEPVL